MQLPEPCPECAPYGGNWRMTENGMRRCTCSRGVALRNASKPPVPQAPVVPLPTALLLAESLAVMEFFPADAMARSAIAEEICSICRSESEARWLCQRMRRLYRKWPGVIEMRLVYCSQGIPLDGAVVNSISPHYPDGIPSEHTAPFKQLAAPEVKALPAGHSVSADTRLETAMGIAAGIQRVKDLDFGAPATAEEIAAAPEWLRKLEGYDS
jgi:hypothetical protein